MYQRLTTSCCHTLIHRYPTRVACRSSRRRLPFWASPVAITLVMALATGPTSATSGACNSRGLEYSAPQPMTVDWWLFTQTLESTLVSALKEDGKLVANLETTRENASEPLLFQTRPGEIVTSIDGLTFGVRYNSEKTIMNWQTRSPSKGYAILRGTPPLIKKVRIIVNDAYYNWIVTDLAYILPRTPTQMLADVACFLTSQPSKE